ncbi:MAG: hypothetical protein ACPLRM_06530 [Anaerolineae bacterium]
MLAKIVIAGVEYNISKQSDSTILERLDSKSGMMVRNVFSRRPDAESRMNAFMEQVADLVLQNTTT